MCYERTDQFVNCTRHDNGRCQEKLNTYTAVTRALPRRGVPWFACCCARTRHCELLKLMKSKKSHFSNFNEKFTLECEDEHTSVGGVTGREAAARREVHDPWLLTRPPGGKHGCRCCVQGVHEESPKWRGDWRGGAEGVLMVRGRSEVDVRFRYSELGRRRKTEQV